MKKFSRKALIAIILLWFATAIFAYPVVWKEPSQLSDLLLYVGGPMSAGIVGYLIKSAKENTAKIKHWSKEKIDSEESSK